MRIFKQVKRPFRWVRRRAYNTWFWAMREASLRQLFDMCPDGYAHRGDYPSDKFKALLRACGIDVKPHATYGWCELVFRGKSRRFDEWPRGELVNVIIICNVREFLISVGVSKPEDIYNHLHSV